MNRGKTGLIVLTFIAAMFFLFIAVLFGSSAERNTAISRKVTMESALDSVASEDLMIYWIGEMPPEFEHLSPVISQVAPESVSSDTIPVKGALFHTTEINSLGQVVKEDAPVDYPENLLIVINGNIELNDKGKAALLDAITSNGVPVLAIGDEASGILEDLLSRSRYKKGPGSSFYYCLNKGYTENPLPVEAVKNGGMELAEAFPEIVMKACEDYVPIK